MDIGSRNSRVRLKVKDKSLTRSKVIETIFVTTEIPFVRVFGDFPVYTALCTEGNANNLLKPVNKEKLKKKGIEVQTPIELKARRTVFMRRLDRHVGQHTAEEIKTEIERNHDKINVPKK